MANNSLFLPKFEMVNIVAMNQLMGKSQDKYEHAK
jgi:hypothetical protein